MTLSLELDTRSKATTFVSCGNKIRMAVWTRYLLMGTRYVSFVNEILIMHGNKILSRGYEIHKSWP